MALQGTLKDFGLADILQLIGIQRKTGILSLDNGQERVSIKFEEGQVVGADSSSRNLEDLLGSVLVRTGRITESQLAEALRTQRQTLQRLGYILLKSGAITEDVLRDALRIQVAQMIYRLFRWKDGRYDFVPADRVDYDRDHFQPISAETILMEGARMVDEWPIIERRIRSPQIVFRKTAAGAAVERPVASLVEAHVDFGFAGERSESEEGIRLSPEEREVLRMVDGRATVQDLVDRSALGEFDVYRALHELLNRNLIEEAPLPAAAGARAAAKAWPARGHLAAGATFAAALLALLTLEANPAAPWTASRGAAGVDPLKQYAHRARLERIGQAVRVFYFDLALLPDRLETLARTGYLAPSDLVDPWGRPYHYETDSTGYRIAGLGPDGTPTPDLVLEHRFSAAERLVLEGGRRSGAAP
jgi:hypothetical protein